MVYLGFGFEWFCHRLLVLNNKMIIYFISIWNSALSESKQASYIAFSSKYQYEKYILQEQLRNVLVNIFISMENAYKNRIYNSS